MYKFIESYGKIIMVEIIDNNNAYQYGDIIRHAIYVAGMQKLSGCDHTTCDINAEHEKFLRFAGQVETNLIQHHYWLYTDGDGKEYLLDKEIFSL